MPTDEQYYHNLAYARARQKELEDLNKTARTAVRKPSVFKYGVLFFLAGVSDLADFAQLTGIGILLTWAVKIIVSPILFLAGWGASSRIKTMNRFRQNSEMELAHIGRRIAFLGSLYTKTLKGARRISFLRKPARKAALRVARLRKATLRNPFIKNTLAIVIDFIPGPDFMFWRTLGIFLTYRDEKRTYEETLELVPEMVEAKQEEIAVRSQAMSIPTEEVRVD